MTPAESLEWARYNVLTATYDTPDGTHVATELVDSVQCLADVLYIATIRASQRAAKADGLPLYRNPKESHDPRTIRRRGAQRVPVAEPARCRRVALNGVYGRAGGAR